MPGVAEIDEKSDRKLSMGLIRRTDVVRQMAQPEQQQEQP